MWTRITALVVFLCIVTVPTHAAAAPTEYEVKAVYLINFTRFIQWPANAFATATAPFVLCVVGDNPFGSALADASHGDNVQGRPLEVRGIPANQDLRACQIAFFSRTAAEVSNVITQLRSLPILTVTEADTSLPSARAKLNFVRTEQNIRFEVSDEILLSQLKISSKLLALAYVRK